MVKFLSLFLLIALSFSQSIRAQACDPPEVGNTASNLTVTVGASVSLKVSATGTALTYQWQVSSNGGTSFSDLSDGGTYSGTTTAVLNIANAVSTLHQYKFRCIVSSKQLCSTTSGSTTLVVNSVPLCSSTPTEFCCEYVNTVVLNGITFSGNTGFNGPGYYDYTGTVIPTVTAGTSIPVSVKVVTNSPYQEFVKIWIDFNRDGIPGNDPTELVFNQNTTVSGTHTFSGNIAVPTNAFNGNLYARLIMQYNGSPIVCGNYDYGNTFDFKIPVTGGVNPNILTMGVQHEQGAAGTVSSNPLGINTQSNGYQSFFSANQVVTLTAAPAANSVFDGWYGDVVSTANPLAVTMNGSKNIVAKFKLLPPPDVLLSNTVIYGNQQSSLVGNFSSVAGDTKTYTYSLVSGTGSTDNALFSINGSQLLVNNLQSLTKTDYSIRVRSTSNTATTMEKVFAIKYYGVPGTPTVESVISGSGEATVVFNEPSDSGGSPVTNYYVENASGSVVASGTSSPITVTGLTNGTSYTFKVKAENSAGIGGLSNASPAIVPGVVKSNVSCNGGSNGYAMVVTAGTVNGYTFSWSPKSGSGQVLTGLTSGIYTCEISKGNQVLAVREFTITQPAPFTATAASQTNVSCNGGSNGSATVSATSGTGSYSYSWSPSGGTAAKATGLSAGTYTVTVTDANACTTTQSFTITQPAAFIATAAAQTNVSCNGGSNGSATVSATGGTGSYSYSWFPSGGTAAKATGLSAGTYTVTVTDANACTTTQSFTITQPTALIATAASQTNLSCHNGTNGSATVSATGGTGTYSYSWSPSGGTAAKATGLSAGTYTVTVTDANMCTTTQSFTITQPTALIATAASQTNVSCHNGTNGSATVSATGGTGTYSYSWSPSGGTAAKATGLSAGTYTVTVTDANACTTTQSFTITEPAAFIATAASQTNVSCNGGSNGSATVSATGGTGTYTYSWSPSGGTAATATGLSAGTYTVTVTDANACMTTQSFTITEPAAFIATAASQTNVSCNGGSNGSATVSATGGTGTYTYLWSPRGGTAAKATGLSAGTYTVTVTDANACTTTQSFTITQPTALIATAASQTNVSCNGGSNGSATVSATGGTGTYTYLWSPRGGTAATATGLSAGTYTVTVTDANMCTTTQSFTITEPAAFIATAASQTNVSCHNGSNGSATVSATGGTGTYTYSWSPRGGTAATATGLSAGTYTVTVTDANMCTTTQSFTITEPAAFIATAASQTNVSCNGGSNGSATVSATGGTGSYSYSWFPSGGTAATATGLSAGTYTVTVTDANACTTTQSFTITEPAAFIATAASQTNVSCNGGSNGSATVSATGGTGTYTYSWSPSGGTAATATGLSAGTYTVTVTDANMCTTTQSFTITQPAAFIATAESQTNVSCHNGSNGSATVSVTGGTGSYSYSWFPSGGTAAKATVLSAGTYTVTVTDANACTTTQSFTITQPAAFIATAASQTKVSCHNGSNGSATVSVTGGTGTYTYSWSPRGGTAATATGLSAGTYTVTVTDANACTTTQSFTITEPTALIATAEAQTNVSCNGGSNGSATVSATGGTGAYTYSWSPRGGTAATATGLSAGTYTVTVTDANACITTQSFTITEPAVLSALANQDFAATCPKSTDAGATVVASGGTAPYTYNWDNGAVTASVENLSVGNHTVTITDFNGCTATTTVVTTFHDTVNPVPSLAQLPNVVVQCAVTPSDIAVPTATDNCSGTLTATTTDALSYTEQGTYTITWKYDDANGNITTQQQTVIVKDVTAPVPVITNLATITRECAVTPSDIAVPTATDNCSGTLTATTTDALSYTEQGTYTITWKYDDANGNITTQQQTVIVKDVTAPVPVVANLATITRECAVTPSDIAVPTATDNCSGTLTATTTDALSYTKQGTYTITWKYDDANGNITTQQQTVVVKDVTAPVPVITNLATITRECAVTPSDIAVPTATDNCSGTLTATTTDALSYTKQGTYIITWKYDDANGNITTQQQTVVVKDVTAPVPVVANLATITRECAITPSDIAVPTATDNCSGTLTATTTDALSYTKQGTYTITWKYDDANGNITTQQQTVVVKDVTAPVSVITNLATITRECAVTPSDIAVPTATDNCSGTLTATTTDALSYTKQGTYTITWTYDDSNGNITTQQQTVVVKDVTAPVPTVANLATITRECAVTPSDIAVPTATDNCSGTLKGTTTNALSYTKQGTYIITWKYDDANGNITTQQQTVVVKDVTAPVPVVANLATITRECAITPSDIAVPTATDNCSGTLTATTTDALSYTKQGTYTITWKYDDANGNITTQQQTVVVKDVTAPVPVITNLATITRECAVTPSDIAVPTATDNCSGTLTATTTDALSYTKQGTYTITWKYDDANGNITTQQQTVVVKDVTAPVPVVANLATITRECAVTPSDIAVPTATDNCSGTLTATTTNALSYTKQGTYTITWKYDDANGNITTQQQTVIVKDVTAPVPVVANLVTITRECAVTPSDIAVPTATDNCSGTLTATTTDALSYTKQGTYTITWTYDDSNGNITTQQQTVVVEASPLAEIEFSDVVTVYNGAVQKAEVANVPSGATVSYSITPDTGEGNGALNAGTYTVTAVVTPPATAVNCESVTLVAQLLIEKAAQNIDFKEPELVLLETAKDFQLTAKSDSGLPVSYTYSYTQDTPAATVTAQGWVAIKHSGSVAITAHQQGNQNYLPAPSVERMLVIESRDAAVHEVIINGKVYSEPGSVIYYIQDCNGTEDQIPVKVEAEHGANVTPARDFVINTPKPGVYRKTVAVVSQNGEFSRTYEIVVERPFAFEDIVIQKFDNTLLVNNNPQTNGGYRFIKYQWYRNGSLIGEEQVYSAGNSQQDILDENALYSVVVTTEEGDVIHSCAASIAREHEFKIQVYPNPVQVNEQLQVVFDYPSASFKGAKAELYTTAGKRLQSVFLEQTASAVQLPAGISAGVYMLVLHIEGRQEIVKVIVKQ